MATAEHLERNQWGWGKIKVGNDYEWYPRISTLAGVYKDTFQLDLWKNRLVAKGVAADAALQQQILLSNNNQELNELVDRAFIAAGGKTAANKGTLIHELTEKVDRGENPDIPPEYRGVIESYVRAIDLSGLKPHMSEQFVVNDDLKVCGSFDRSWITPGGVHVIGDLMSGARVYPHQVAMQLAMYANGVLYDPVTEERTPLGDVSTEVGVLIHAPLAGGCKIIGIELEDAYKWVSLAVESRAWHKTTISFDWSK